MAGPRRRPVVRRASTTSVDKALELCELLSASEGGASLRELAKGAQQPAPTVHRLLAVLKRRGYVRQDEETQRYSLTLKMLDLSFRLLGRSELRLHAYPVLREYVLRTGERSFIAFPATGEVTYIWSAGPDEVAMRTVYGRPMPGHCSIYFAAPQATRRLSCLKLVEPRDVGRSEAMVLRLGPPAATAETQRLCCTCAPVHDYTGREVARVGLFRHDADEAPTLTVHNRGAWELARQISLRLGHLSAGTMEVSA